MLALNISVRTLFASVIPYGLGKYLLPALDFSSELALGQFIFLASILVVPVPWVRLIRPIDLRELRSQIPIDDTKIACVKMSSTQDCEIVVGARHKIAIYLDMVNSRAMKRSRQIEEDLYKELMPFILIISLVFIVSYYKSKFLPPSSPSEHPVVELAAVITAITTFAFFIGRIFGEITTERKANIDAADLL